MQTSLFDLLDDKEPGNNIQEVDQQKAINLEKERQISLRTYLVRNNKYFRDRVASVSQTIILRREI